MHIKINDNCTYKCVFCYDSKNVTANNRYISISDYTHLLDNYLDRVDESERIVLTGGEPTFHPDLIKFISMGKERGKDVYVISNGGRLSDIRYFEELIQAGLHTVQLSLHGSNETIHDSVTGTKGAFSNLAKAIENAKILSDVRVCTNSVINKLNYFNSESLINYIENDIQPDAFLIASCFGDLPEYKSNNTVAINYIDVIPLFEQLLLHVELKNLHNGIFISCFPTCLTEKSVFRPSTRCSACDSSLQFLQNGSLIPCPCLSDTQYQVRLKDFNSFEDITNRIRYNFNLIYNDLLPKKCKTCSDLADCKSACFIKHSHEVEDNNFSNSLRSYLSDNSMPSPMCVIPELNYSIISSNGYNYNRVQVDLNNNIKRRDILKYLSDIESIYPSLEFKYFYPPKVVVYERQNCVTSDTSHEIATNLWKKILSTTIIKYVDHRKLMTVIDNIHFKEENI